FIIQSMEMVQSSQLRPEGAQETTQLMVLSGWDVHSRLRCLPFIALAHVTQTARVIYEVPHIDSEVAEMDKHSTNSSTGSTEWCQVPVYESCDYFERVQTKESR
ncbi:uncharacterized protein AKAME5_001563500, partial [Lates japonicus]